ncbi:MAG: hypothetical protein H8F28_22110 [Fibrella sp.]|nr:hypothetical protein [Armatimonadota bacterium]
MREKYLIESNGQVYGPADVDQLIQWVAEGRVVSTTTLINAETSERKLAGDHAELRSWFAPTPPTTPSTGATAYQTPPPQGRAGDYPSPGGSGVGGYPGGYGQQQRQQPPQQPWSGSYQQPIAPGYGAQMYGDRSNDSGTGAMARLPAELQGVNFGAFAIPIWWGIFNQSFLGLLAFIPCLSPIVSIVMLFKGNEWAWQNRRFESVEHFRQVQRAWQNWGIAAFILNVIWGIGWLISVFAGNN